jgi:hypothetical protein
VQENLRGLAGWLGNDTVMTEIISLRTEDDYASALLVLMNMIGSAMAADIYNTFESQLSHLIVSEHLETDARDDPLWVRILRNARRSLEEAGFMTSDGYGRWTRWSITDAGRVHLEQRLNGGMENIVQAWSSLIEHGISILPTVDNATRAAASTSSNDRMAHTILDSQIGQIRQFLQGRIVRPSDELLCDWVHFCYTFRLYDEGYKLFPMIDETMTAVPFYTRAKKLARACQLALGRQSTNNE